MPSIPNIFQFVQSETGKMVILALVAGYLYTLHLRTEYEAKFKIQQLDILTFSALFGVLFYVISIFLTLPLRSVTTFEISSKFQIIQFAAVFAALVSISGIRSLNELLMDEDRVTQAMGSPSSWGAWMIVIYSITAFYVIFIPSMVALGFLEPVSQFKGELLGAAFFSALMFSFIATYAWEWTGLISARFFEVDINEDRADFRLFNWLKQKIESSKLYMWFSRIMFLCTFLLAWVAIEGREIPFRGVLLTIFLVGSVLPFGSLLGSLIGEYLQDIGYFPLKQEE